MSIHTDKVKLFKYPATPINIYHQDYDKNVDVYKLFLKRYEYLEAQQKYIIEIEYDKKYRQEVREFFMGYSVTKFSSNRQLK